MRLQLIFLILVFDIQRYFAESQAKQEQEQSANNAVEAINAAGTEDETDVAALAGPIKEVTAQTGGTANLPCKFSDAGGAIVTWLRRRDRQLLTVGMTTHSVDKRFMIKQSASDFTLLIRQVTLEDAGFYECQVVGYPVEQYFGAKWSINREIFEAREEVEPARGPRTFLVASYPIQQNFVRLSVTEAYSIIPGGPDLHVKQGSSLRLECQLMAATEPPFYVFWYQQGHMINYDADPGVNIELTKSGSVLKVDKTKMSHGGNYTCMPSNAKGSFVMIHVIEEEEKPAAMHGGDRRNPSPAILASNFLASFLAAVSWRIPSFSSLYPT